MSGSSKITLRVSPGKRGDTITWRAVGSYLGTLVNQVTGETSAYLMPSASDPQAYWHAVLTAVLAELTP
jgi:hypothetical protein